MPGLSRTVLIAVLSAALCSLGLLAAPGAAAAPAEETGLVRMMHLSPDTPSIDAFIDHASIDSVSAPGAQVLLPALGYGDVSAYQRVPAGSYTVSARAAGADPASPPVLATAVTVAPGTATTVAAVGRFADLGLAVRTDDLTLPPAGAARVRVVNAAATGSPLDVALGGGTVLAADLAFADSTEPVDVPGGARTLLVTDSGGTPVELSVDLAAGSVHTVLVLDRADGGLTVRVTLDAAAPGVVPVGGVEAGGGGTATDDGPPVGRAALAALSLTALLLAVGLRRPRPGHPQPPPDLLTRRR
ncbi:MULTISPECIES: DUF4397 domain-containing protein [unclassified Modestobacter]|uniref:DUF4397 domain-containing protein n=1 Tax=unclassified Modestobacter TaxID=2643866 RepID=UPI0022AB2496|nr:MULTISPECIES: DUF4397 domain-containing protein [unclassified Modestobacter]MCZ2823979.1 DUF4397 domain-containing protein [Modestobacter sp. VKM Ac-2981]MCZ2852224.1 DUF4397 domain-containing protein [Modestobacter sp. VKM Ac-2982]